MPLQAIDAETGMLIWQVANGGGTFSSPAIANGVIYSGGADGVLYAHNAGSGVLLWSFNTGATINSSPVVAEGSIYASSDLDVVHVYGLPWY